VSYQATALCRERSILPPPPSRSRELGYRRDVPDHEPSPGQERVRCAELVAALCLATDLAMGFPFEHGLHATQVATRLGDRLAIDTETASDAYYACLLSYCGERRGAEQVADDKNHGGDRGATGSDHLRALAGAELESDHPGYESCGAGHQCGRNAQHDQGAGRDRVHQVRNQRGERTLVREPQPR
jgi:hypothetical protein